MLKVIHWELWKKLKFDHATEWSMHKPESILCDTNGSQLAWLGDKGDPQGITQVEKIGLANKREYVLQKQIHKIVWRWKRITKSRPEDQI